MTHTVTFEKIVPEGKAMVHFKGKALFVVGPLPGETAIIEVVREKARWAEAVVKEITTQLPQRHEAQEPHFMNCSPWQGVEYGYQQELKRAMLSEVFARPELRLKLQELVRSPQELGYRNKLDFVFMPGTEGRVELALHERGSDHELVPAPQGCVLGSEAMNLAARQTLEQINRLDLATLAQSLMVRQSHTTGDITVVLTVKARARRDWQSLRVPKVSGAAVICKMPTGKVEFIWGSGELKLTERLGGVELMYPWEAFSQVNLPVFGQALERILALIAPDTKVVDLYGGVGAIGLPVAKIAREVVGVEVSASAVAVAALNAKHNKLTNYRTQLALAEDLDLHVLEGADTVIIDPPRAGLDTKVIELLLAANPRQVIYLSCNPVTQARDIILLKAAYDASAVTGFDFYPGTLHVESLVTLTRR